MGPLVLCEPSIVGQIEPIALSIEHSHALGRVYVELNQLVLVLQCDFILINVLTNVIHLLTIDPRATKEAGALTLLLAYHFPAVHTVIHESMTRALAVADLSSGYQEL